MSALPKEGPFKIVILGEGRVGKTSLLQQFVKKTFDEQQASTQSAAYLDKTVQVRGVQVQLSLWDTAGQERFHSLAPIYYRDADGALLVYDVTDPETFKRVAKWVEELKMVKGSGVALAIVGNKIDLRTQARVPVQDAEAYARDIGARHSLASAKLGQGVEEAFTRLTEDVLVMKSSDGAGGERGRSRQRRGPMVGDDPVDRVNLDDPSRSSSRRKSCCGSK